MVELWGRGGREKGEGKRGRRKRRKKKGGRNDNEEVNDH
jgi:hypothetical protein